MRGAYPLDGNGHKHHGDGGKYQTEGQKAARVAAVGDAGHQKLGETVGNGVHRKYNAQFVLAETKGCQHGNGHGEILAHNVESGISDEDAEKYLPAQAAVTFVGLGTGLYFFKSRWLQKIVHRFNVYLAGDEGG
jgi:hypothetical protein